jgi:hypothetical protein
MNVRILFAVQFAALLAFGSLLSNAASRLSATETVIDADRGFTLRLPEGFVANPDIVGAAPNIIHAFVLGDPTDDELDIVLFVEKMQGTIGREHLKREDLPAGFNGRLFKTIWHGFEVDAFEVPEQLGDIPTVTYNVQIPLKRAAIQVKLFGPAGRDSELKPLLSEILGGLTGESNWIPSAVPETASDDYRLVLVAMTIAIIVGGLFVLFLISKRTPKGTVLAIAAAMYVVSWSIDGIRLREAMMLCGSLRMLGFAGGILGIIDLVRKRKRQSKTDDGSSSNELHAGSDRS